MLIAQTTSALTLEVVTALVGVGAIFVGTVGAWWDLRNKVKTNTENIARLVTLVEENTLLRGRVKTNEDTVVRLERMHERCSQDQAIHWDEVQKLLLEMNKILSSHDTKLDLLVTQANGKQKGASHG